jgi:hypothetical protein
MVTTAMGASACRREILLPTVKTLAGIAARVLWWESWMF